MKNGIFVSRNLGVALRIKEGGYIPKSGLLLANVLDYCPIQGRVLDIGTGEIGFLAHYLLSAGASVVFASDIDEYTIEHASQSSDNSSNIKWIISDVFSGITELDLDLIISNPPQMPCESGGYNDHDFGGDDGRNIILRIISNSSNYMVFGGHLIILCFDFLGVESRFNSQKSIMEIARDFGFKALVLGRFPHVIRRGGKTEENLDWIRKIYPRYEFKKTPENNFSHEIIILELTKW